MNRIRLIGAVVGSCALAACNSTPKAETAPTPAPSTRPAPATPAQVTPAPAPMGSAAFQPSKLVASTDSYQAVAGGQPVGVGTVALSREGSNYRFVVDLVFQGGAIHQRVEDLFNATTLMPLSQSMSFSMQGTAGNTHITVADGRAKGTAQVPAPGGITTTNVDLAVPAGTVDDEASASLILTLNLAEGFKTSFTTLATTPSEIRANELTVQGKETVTVPGGTFETYRVLIHSNEDVTMFVTTGTPRRIVLIRSGNGVELQLMK